MAWLSVTSTTTGLDSMINIPVEDTLYIEHDISDRKVYAFTDIDKYYLPGPLNFWADALKAYGFERGDRNLIIQISKIKSMSRRPFCCAYFALTPKAIKVELSEQNYKRIEKLAAGFNEGIVLF
ncbi:LytTR family DNA-binding domain-containing protein [Cohnella fermenti]|uniref:LytTR family transcriptional regulator n=1 Tax=Cohnella fermenti TaxID=2565925 RepID=A0A4S4BMY9_9BACL|nr:LytTR family DNA-binding domain-containing protein [Cohnella fermenti]THF76229.1 LytTR family transcriptional regulator [Cohnella fermenti]